MRYTPRFDPDNFVRVADNRYFPLKPGTRFVYFGEEDGEAEKNVTVVTHDRKEILGISAIVVLDQVFVHGELKEKTFDWYAQDRNGNVWYLGEDTKEFEDGKVVSTEGSWEAGVDGAEAGIIMPAHPQVGQRYRQEFFDGERRTRPGWWPSDSTSTCPTAPSITVSGRRVHRLEPGVVEAKFYCPNVGFVKAGGLEGPPARLVLKHIF